MRKIGLFLCRIAYGAFLAPLLSFTAMSAVYFTVWNIADFTRSADLVDLAFYLERGAAPDYLSMFDTYGGGTSGSTGCGDASSRSKITVALAALGEADHENHVQEVSDDLGPAIDAAEYRLNCSPLDGNAWLQWSKLQLRASGPIPRVLEGLKRSALFAPSESWILKPRLDVEAKLSAAGISELDLQYEADLRQFIFFEDAGAVAAAYVNHDDAVRQRMRPLIEAQSSGRRKAVAAEIDRLGVDFLKS